MTLDSAKAVNTLCHKNCEAVLNAAGGHLSKMGHGVVKVEEFAVEGKKVNCESFCKAAHG